MHFLIQNYSILDVISWEKLINDWLIINLTIWIGTGEKLLNLIQADLEANDLIDHGQLLVKCF